MVLDKRNHFPYSSELALLSVAGHFVHEKLMNMSIISTSSV